jgi:uncharacterized protein (TIGR02996 family)
LDELRTHLPFLRAIESDPVDEAGLLIYADWLEERCDSRAEVLRLFCRFVFREDLAVPGALAAALSAQPGGWLYHVFGGAERARSIRERIEAS